MLEARRLLAEVEQELWPVLRLPTTVGGRDRALACYCLRDLLDGRLDPLVAAERIGFELCPADDPGSPLWPVRGWLYRAEDQQEHSGGLTKKLVPNCTTWPPNCWPVRCPDDQALTDGVFRPSAGRSKSPANRSRSLVRGVRHEVPHDRVEVKDLLRRTVAAVW
ncbi:hypothetical protein ACH4E7_21520 [Kitasatospora sp. NPDC018058]|uniref:hypothetical protein n=1 Tax=Kitasatospora sp. NPDC018058 TaxID=3364025 RepID=UPI0037BFB84F